MVTNQLVAKRENEMNAIIVVAITDSDGDTDILVKRRDRLVRYDWEESHHCPVSVHIKITDKSFIRIARLIVQYGTKIRQYAGMVYYQVDQRP
jgi:hypothetical protein